MQERSAKPNRRWSHRRSRRGGQRSPNQATQPDNDQENHLIVTARPQSGKPARPPKGQTPPNQNGSQKARGQDRNQAQNDSGRRRDQARQDPGGLRLQRSDRRSVDERRARLHEPAMMPVSFPVGACVRLCDALRQRGGHGRVGTVTWSGNLVDVRWEDDTMSYMLVPGLLELATDIPPLPSEEPELTSIDPEFDDEESAS